MPSQTYDFVNRAWKKACKVLFREEVGELAEFEDWLLGYDLPKIFRKSSVSGKEVALPSNDYCPHSRFISFDEIFSGKKFEPIGIILHCQLFHSVSSIGFSFTFQEETMEKHFQP